MMKRVLLLTWLLATFLNSGLFSQSKDELRNNFYDAESWILFEAYQDALPLYQQLLRKYPDNSNFKYRIGQCYMNIPGEKTKAVSYLEDAIKNIDPKYKEGKFNESGAPYDALYYLANAYRINNQIDKALRAYELFKKNLNTEIYDTTVVNMQIQSCRNAKELMRMPLFVKQQNLGNVINSYSNDFNPVISDKEDLLVFSRSQAFYDALLYSTKENGVWTEPKNMNEILKIDRDLFPTSISKDGKDLYLYSSADYDGIIYTTRLENGTWSPIVKLNDNINTKYWESHATISHNNKKLYFTSNRKGTYGGLDIYVSSRDSTGDWGSAVNLGPVINTPYNEESPFLSEDDKTLFFSSRGHFNMGGYDIFYSTLLPNGEWSVPLNVGYPLNSTDDDVFFKPINQGYEGYTAKELPGGYGKQDIYRIEIFSNDHPRKFFVRGMVKIADLINNINDSVKVSAMNIKNTDQTIIVYSNPKTGEYEFQLPQGDYKITYEGDGGEKVVRNIDLPLLNPSDSFVLPRTILPKTDFVADLNVEANKTISVTKGDSILFPMKVEPNSILTVEHWVGDSLVSVEHFTMTGSTFNYKMAPNRGNNRLVFKLTDKFNNSTKTEVLITRTNKIITQPIEHPEYSRIISQKQIASLASLLRDRAKDSLLNVITETNIENKQFGSVDDYISLLKAEAAKKGIGPDEMAKLALRVAVLDNVLSQAAVDYLAKHTAGDLKAILSNTDIYSSNLKTWTDLQTYINKQTGGKITPEELNRIAAAVLAETDPYIGMLKKQILAFSENTPSGDLVRQVVASLDKSDIRSKGQWLLEFYKNAIERGLSQQQISELLVKLSSLPDTDVEQYLRDLISHSDEPFASLLKSIDLKKENIRTPEELISYLFANKDKFPLESLSKSMADLIAAKNISMEKAKTPSTGTEHGNLLWIIWALLGAGIIGLFIIFWLRKRKKNK
jgi:LPXTG-motif cell wall-anchored protein